MTDEPTTTTTPRARLYAALVAAQRAASAVEKDGTNSFHRYKYASAEAIIAEARAALSGAGIAVFVDSWELSRAGGAAHATVRVVYVVAHESGESVTCSAETSAVEEKGRPADKAEATALTYSLGYFLRGLLLLPRVEADHEVDRRDDTAHAPRAAVAPRMAPKPPAATVPAPPPAHAANTTTNGAALPTEPEAIIAAFATVPTQAAFAALSAHVSSHKEAFDDDERAVMREAAHAAKVRLGGAS